MQTTQPRPDNNTTNSALDRYINIGLIILITLSTTLAIYSSIKLINITGPTSLTATTDGNVIVALSDRIIIMNKQGAIISEGSFDDLGLQGPINDMQSLANGSLIIGDRGSRTLYSCDNQLSTCNTLMLRTDNHYDAGKYHKFYVDEANQTILLTNTERHELVLLNMDASLKTVLISKNEMLGFPDGIYVKNNNEVYLANALKKQILHLDVTGTSYKTLNSYPVQSIYSVNNQNLPMALSIVNNNQWWVAAQASTLTGIGASITKYDNTFSPIGRVMNPYMVHPVDILDIGKTVLVADQHAYKVFQFDHNGNGARVFGDARFNTTLDSQKSATELNGFLRWFSIGLIITALLLALIVEGVRKKEKIFITNMTSDTNSGDTLTLSPPEWMVKLFRITPVVILLLLGASSFLLFGSMPEFVFFIGGIEALIFLVVLSSMYTAVQHMPKVIQIKSGNITITSQKDEPLSDVIQNISYTANAIWIKDTYFNLGANGAVLNDKNGYRSMMAALTDATKLSRWSMLSRMYRKDMVPYILMTVSLLAIFALLLNNAQLASIIKETEILKQVVNH